MRRRPTLGVILHREALRSARRVQTWVLRLLFTAFVLGALALLWVDLPTGDPARIAREAREIFFLFLGLQLGIAAVLAPLLVASGIAEEREDRTLELLALTRLGPGAIVRGKVLSRLLVLVTVVVGTAPALALILSLGGISPWELVNGVLATLLVVLLLGWLGGLLALGGWGPFVATALALFWAVSAFFVVPFAYAITLEGEPEGLAHLSPPMALSAATPLGLLPWLAFAPVLWILLRWSGPLFALRALRTEAGPGLEAPETHHFDRLRWRLGLGGLAVLLLLPVGVGFPYLVVGGDAQAPLWMARALGWGWSVLLLATGTGLFLLLAMHYADRLRWWRGAMKAALGGSWRRAIGLGPPLWVWSNPVAWREVMTRAQGGEGAARWGVLAWGALLVLFAAVEAREVATGLAVFTGSGIAAGGTVLFGTGSLGTERRTGALALLVSTPLSAGRILLGKLCGVAASTGPYLLVGWGVFYGTLLVSPSLDSCGPPTFLGRSVLAHLALTGAWVGGVWVLLALASLGAALWTRTLTAARGGVLAAGVVLVLVPLVLAALVGGQPGAFVITGLLPMVSGHWIYPSCGPDGAFLLSTLGVWGLAGVGFAVLVRAVERRALG